MKYLTAHACSGMRMTQPIPPPPGPNLHLRPCPAEHASEHSAHTQSLTQHCSRSRSNRSCSRGSISLDPWIWTPPASAPLLRSCTRARAKMAHPSGPEIIPATTEGEVRFLVLRATRTPTSPPAFRPGPRLLPLFPTRFEGAFEVKEPSPCSLARQLRATADHT